MSAMTPEARAREIEVKVAPDVMLPITPSLATANVGANDNSNPSSAARESNAASVWGLPRFPGVSWFGG